MTLDQSGCDEALNICNKQWGEKCPFFNGSINVYKYETFDGLTGYNTDGTYNCDHHELCTYIQNWLREKGSQKIQVTL